MKNSAWYHKLWRKKLNKLPIRESSESAWLGMKEILDQHMPPDIESENISKASSGSKILKLVGYIAPAVAAVSIITYVNYSTKDESRSVGERKNELYLDSIGNQYSTEKKNMDETSHSEVDTAMMRFPDNEPILWTDSVNLSNEQIEPLFSEESRELTDNKNDLVGDQSSVLISNFDTSGTVFSDYSNREKKDLSIHGYSKTKRGKDSGMSRKNRKIRQYSALNLLPSSYGVEVGTNVGGAGNSFYVGAFGDFPLTDSWFINLGVYVSSFQKVQGEFLHPSFFRPDSLRYSFEIKDTRKVALLDIPLKLEYKLTEVVSLNAGLIINFPISQSSVRTDIGAVPDRRDTLFYKKEIVSALARTEVNKVNLGISSGINVKFKSFDLRGSYHLNTPYRVGNTLGSYRLKNSHFRVGIGYRFK